MCRDIATKCPSCGSENREQAVYCDSCGGGLSGKAIMEAQTRVPPLYPFMWLDWFLGTLLMGAAGISIFVFFIFIGMIEYALLFLIVGIVGSATAVYMLSSR